jgi:hypothetical protein
MTVEEISRYTGLQQKQQIEALDDLVRVGFLSYNSADFMYAVERWNEKAGDSSRDRTRRFRERHRDVSETLPQQKSDGTDKEEEKDTDTVTQRVTNISTKTRQPSGRDLAAYAIMDAVLPVVSERHDLAMTVKTWRTRNKASALDLVDLGKTPAEAVEMLRFAYDDSRAKKYYGGITTLAKLAEHWPALVKMTRPQELTPEQIADAKMRGYFMPGGGGEEAYRHDCGVSA